MKSKLYRSLAALGCILGFSSVGSAVEQIDSTTVSANVARALVTSAIENREPVDELTVVPASTRTVFFFTDLRNLAGAEVTHRWSHGGEVVAEVPFQVGGNRWRVWSSKELDPVWAGEWQLSVLDTEGTLLDKQTFLLEEMEAPEMEAPEMKAPTKAPTAAKTTAVERETPEPMAQTPSHSDATQGSATLPTEAASPPAKATSTTQ